MSATQQVFVAATVQDPDNALVSITLTLVTADRQTQLGSLTSPQVVGTTVGYQLPSSAPLQSGHKYAVRAVAVRRPAHLAQLAVVLLPRSTTAPRRRRRRRTSSFGTTDPVGDRRAARARHRLRRRPGHGAVPVDGRGRVLLRAGVRRLRHVRHRLHYARRGRRCSTSSRAPRRSASASGPMSRTGTLSDEQLPDLSGQSRRLSRARRNLAAALTRLDGVSEHILTAVAWPYANGPRHIGHVAGFGVPSDVFSRYQRMAGNKVLMVSGTDEHGTPIQVQADAEGVTPARAGRPLQPGDRPGPRRPRADLRPVHPHHDAEPLPRSRRRSSSACSRTATCSRSTELGAISPSTGRTLPDRYIEGTCPICGYPSARGDQCDNCGNQLDPIDLINPALEDQRRDAEVRRDRAVLPRPARVRRGARRLAALAAALAAERAEVLAQPARRPQAARDHPRPRLGRAGAAGRLARPAGQADLRLVRRRHRLPVRLDRVGRAHRRPGRLAAVVADSPDAPGPTTSWARTTSSSTPRSGRRCCSATPASARKGGEPGRARRAQPAVRGGVERVPDDGGPQVLLQPATS